MYILVSMITSENVLITTAIMLYFLNNTRYYSIIGSALTSFIIIVFADYYKKQYKYNVFCP